MNLYRRVIGYYRPYLGTICFSLILLVIGVNFSLLKYWPVQWVIDHVVTVGPGGEVHWAGFDSFRRAGGAVRGGGDGGHLPAGGVARLLAQLRLD